MGDVLTRLPDLFERYKSLYRQSLEIETELRAVEREILASSPATPTSKPTARPTSKRPGITSSMAKPTLIAIRDVGGGGPAKRRDIAKRLGVSDHCIGYRLQRLRAAGFVDRVRPDGYVVAKEVPADL